MLRRLLITIFAFAALTGLGQSRAHPDPKLAYTFNRIEHQNDYNDSLTVSIALSHGSHLNKLISVQCSYRNYLRARIRLADLPAIIKDSSILFITPLVTPTEELTTGASDPTLNGISLVHARLPQLKGRSLHTSIKERLFDTSDIDFKGRIEKTGVEPASVTAHASLMATIVAGAGNSSLYARGAASMATLSSASFLNLFPEPDSIINRYGISVENHSYGTTVENFYGSEAAAYDMQANQIGSLLHVFSAGNAGDFNNSGGPYTGVQQMANLTGNFKQAKNIITVGSIDSAGQLMPLSSKGPAYDGRIKPDLMAYGEDGSSGAAALVSGAALLVQDAYKQETNRVPPFSLVKAALINAADDVGAPQVDYASGFGSLNAYRAVQTISEHRFIEASSTQGSITGFNLHIPPGIQQLKLTLVWNDPAASPNSAKALINDLDLQLYFPQTGERWDPWVLDPSPNLISLQSVPQRKKDTLNNVEQVTLDQPAEGDYTIEVKGSKINSITQSFALAWQLDTLNSFYWSYPSATDPLIARSTAWLRWNTNMTGVGEIEYATANNNWRSVGIVPDLSKKYFKWTLPDTLATAVLRMKQSSVRAFVSDTFTISPQLQLKTGFVCEDSFLLYWRSIAASYRLFELSSEYLTPFMQLSDT
ncbi:MAG TPA: S8 family serine peptidase, partial [Flavisolibacter sp.]|nr:S8 family serine peptidase [Flavisolibacter sp.]